jgi:SnoaL-like domain
MTAEDRDELDALKAEIQLLKDKAEIREVLDLYWFGEDRLDPDTVATAFTRDAEYGGLQGHEEILGAMEGLRAHDTMQHCFASSRIEVDGYLARADTMAVGFNVGLDDQDQQVCLVRGLRYIDDLVRTGNGWKIRRRRGHDHPDAGHDRLWQFQSRQSFSLAHVSSRGRPQRGVVGVAERRGGAQVA